MDSEGQHAMTSLHNGDKMKRNVSPNFWAGISLVRTGAGPALIGDPKTVAARIQKDVDLDIETFILSRYPHLEEAYTTAELLFPELSIDIQKDSLGRTFSSPFDGDIKKTTV